MSKLLTIPLLALLLAACSSTGDPENELLQATSQPSAEQTQSADASETGSQAAPSTAVLQVTPTLPTDIADLPASLWPTMADPSPTAEDALKDYLLYNQSGETFAYQLVVGCQGLSADPNPNLMCAREPRISDEGGLQTYRYEVGRPPPAVSDYSIGIQGSDSQGWWISWGDIIAR